MHWLSPELSEARAKRLVERQSKAPDLVVVAPLETWACASCADTGPFLIMEDADAHCLTCADLDHLVFLPAGNAALSRRAKQESGLSAVVVRYNRRRKVYQRHGLLVEEAALIRAEERCLADEDARLRRRERDTVRRAEQDVEYQATMAARIARLFPGCPPERAREIAEHAGRRGSGRVGRTAAARALRRERDHAGGGRLGPAPRHRLRPAAHGGRAPDGSARADQGRHRPQAGRVAVASWHE